jgi:AcrR family transcriptional regulator
MISRQKLLEAASRVYAEHGFRGATTRRIADEAGVNEVTIFRLFGSKAQLLAEAMKCTDPIGTGVLPETPQDPERELTQWCEAHLDAMRGARGMIRKALADLEEHPEVAPFVCNEQQSHFARLHAYAIQLARPSNARERDDVSTACAMLFGALFADAMGRDFIPTIYPQPASASAGMYVRVFLRALGVLSSERIARTPSGRAARIVGA